MITARAETVSERPATRLGAIMNTQDELTVPQAAVYLNVSEETVRRNIRGVWKPYAEERNGSYGMTFL